MKTTVMATALAVAFASSCPAFAADERELAQIRNEIKQMRDSYEARIDALEKRLRQAEANNVPPPAAAASIPADAATAPASSPAPSAVAARSNAFNPEVALILGGTYSNLQQDPESYRIGGFLPSGDEVGPGARSFNLGESELTLSANIDPHFAGRLTFALTPDNEAEVEEALVETRALANGVNARAGRFLSSVGYLNSQHAHTWDFVDAPLAYQAFFGGQYKHDGVQLRWLAPTERYLELGIEAGNGAAFPGTDRNRNGIGSTALFAHVGDDIGDNVSWRAGLSYLRNRAVDRSFDDVDLSGAEVVNAFSGKSATWVADGVLKWTPDGNATRTNFKLQGEYFRRREHGTLGYDTQSQSLGSAEAAYSAVQSGWYLQGIYQFMPAWRVGLRVDKLHSGTPDIRFDDTATTATAGDIGRLARYNPSRTSLMFDYSPSEFSRLRLQFARDKSRPDASDNQLFLQYIMSLGAHSAHAF